MPQLTAIIILGKNDDQPGDFKGIPFFWTYHLMHVRQPFDAQTSNHGFRLAAPKLFTRARWTMAGPFGQEREQLCQRGPDLSFGLIETCGCV